MMTQLIYMPNYSTNAAFVLFGNDMTLIFSDISYAEGYCTSKVEFTHIKKPSAWKKVAPHHSFVPQKRSDQ